MSRTSNGKKKYEGRLRKLEKEEEKKREAQRKLDALEDEKWKVGTRNTKKEDEIKKKEEEREKLRLERKLALEEENEKI